MCLHHSNPALYSVNSTDSAYTCFSVACQRTLYD
jgi:hypothetical protein